MRPGSRSRWTKTITLLAVAVLGSCLAPPERQSYQIHPGAPLPASEVSVVLLGDAAVARFDGLTALRGDWSEVRLRPGLHRVEWIDHVPEGSSPQVDLLWLEGANRFEAVLEAGHTYSLRSGSDTRLVDETTALPAPTRHWQEP